MKNNIKNLNTIFAYSDINLIKDNIVAVELNNLEDIITVQLSSSKIKLFKRY